VTERKAKLDSSIGSTRRALIARTTGIGFSPGSSTPSMRSPEARTAPNSSVGADSGERSRQSAVLRNFGPALGPVTPSGCPGAEAADPFDRDAIQVSGW
jgi:hypothetical protein